MGREEAVEIALNLAQEARRAAPRDVCLACVLIREVPGARVQTVGQHQAVPVCPYEATNGFPAVAEEQMGWLGLDQRREITRRWPSRAGLLGHLYLKA